MHKALNKRKLLGYFSSRAAGPMAHATIFFVSLIMFSRFFFPSSFRKICVFRFCFHFAKGVKNDCVFFQQIDVAVTSCVERENASHVFFEFNFRQKNFLAFAACIYILVVCFVLLFRMNCRKKEFNRNWVKPKKNVSISAFRWAFIFVVGPLRVVE